MIYIPVLGRLTLLDYARLLIAFSILIIEPILRFIFAILPLQWLVDYIRETYLRYPGSSNLSSEDARRERLFRILLVFFEN